MKSFIKTITVFLVLNLTAAGFALAQDAPEKQLRKIEETLAQKEAEITQKATEIAEKVAEVAQKKAEAVTKETARALEQEILSRIGPVLSRQHGGAGTVLVVPAEETKPLDLATIKQDLNIMSRILDKELDPDRSDRLSGFYWDITSGSGRYKSFFSGDDRATKVIYVQGYGALFLLKVDFPLSPPAETPQEKEPEEDIDSVWAETKREIYTPEEADRRRRRRSSRRQRGRSEEKYDAQKVETLKRTLTKTLKHAANIRSLKPDESVILTIRGCEPAVAVRSVPSIGAGPEVRFHITHKSIVEVDKTGFSSPTVLIIRAKKSDIDAFSKGDLDFDQFHERVQILTNPNLGGNTGGIVLPLLPPKRQAIKRVEK